MGGKWENKRIGRIGEDIAGRFLVEKGYEIVKRNWGSKWGEIDIVAKTNGIYIFVEVKTKMGESFGSPEEMVNRKKLMQVERIASTFPSIEKFQKRIDVVAVVLNEDLSVKRINHYECVYSL